MEEMLISNSKSGSEITADDKQSKDEGEQSQNIKAKDIFNMIVLLLNHMMAQWNAYMVVFANPGDDAYTSLEIDLGLTETEYGILSGVT